MHIEESHWPGEELANSITHGIGLALSIAALVVMVVLTALRGTAWHIVGCAVYGGSLILLYTASTIYHSLRSPRARHVFRIIDHCSIYVLIAGTYTPFTLVNLRGPWGWTLFGLVWGLAAAGIVFKSFFTHRFEVLSTIAYIAMGWLAVIAIKPMLAILGYSGLAWVFAGGLFYTLGVIFFGCKRIPYNHTIWHLFVLGGSACHFVAVMLYVVPRA